MIQVMRERSVEFAQSEQQRGNRLKETNGVSSTCGTITKELIFKSSKSQMRGKKERVGLRNVCEEIMAEILPNLAKGINL